MEERVKYYTKNDHLFVLTGPSGAGKHEMVKMLEADGTAKHIKLLDTRGGFKGICITVDYAQITDNTLRGELPEDHITVIYINAPYDQRYSRMAYKELKQPADIRNITAFEDYLYQTCRCDWVVNAQDTLEETASLIKEIIQMTTA